MMILFFAALAAQPSSPADPRSDDAVALFDDMCVGTAIHRQTAGDPARFIPVKVDPKEARQVLPEFDPDKAWAFASTRSDVRLFLGFKDGICSTEVIAADRSAIMARLDQEVSGVAAELKTTAKLEQQNENAVNGKPASYRAWRMRTPRGDLLIALTATTAGAADIQHLMTASFVK